MRIAAFSAYLSAWVVFAGGSLAGAIPKIQRQAASTINLKVPVVVGTVLQVVSVFAITLRLGAGALTSEPLALMGILVLAPSSAALFVWALKSALRNPGTDVLVTHGAFGWVRHPMYLAFFMMLIATGLLMPSPGRLCAAIFLYLAGSELRIASEEKDLSERFHAEYEQYCRRTRWRYLPGVR